MSEWVSECVSEWSSDRVTVWPSERASEWVSEWVSAKRKVNYFYENKRITNLNELNKKDKDTNNSQTKILPFKQDVYYCP